MRDNSAGRVAVVTGAAVALGSPLPGISWPMAPKFV